MQTPAVPGAGRTRRTPWGGHVECNTVPVPAACRVRRVAAATAAASSGAGAGIACVHEDAAPWWPCAQAA